MSLISSNFPRSPSNKHDFADKFLLLGTSQLTRTLLTTHPKQTQQFSTTQSLSRSSAPEIGMLNAYWFHKLSYKYERRKEGRKEFG